MSRPTAHRPRRSQPADEVAWVAEPVVELVLEQVAARLPKVEAAVEHPAADVAERLKGVAPLRKAAGVEAVDAVPHRPQLRRSSRMAFT